MFCWIIGITIGSLPLLGWRDNSLDSVKGKTCLIIAHRLSTLKHTDRVLVFEHGRLIQNGKHEDLVAQEGLYKDLWAAQF